MDQGRRLKKGDVLFSEGDVLDKVFVIQSGRVSINLVRSGRTISLEEIGPSQLIGEQAVTGNGKATFNAVATSEVRVLELPATVLKDQIENSAGGVKLMSKSMGDEIKRLRHTLRGHVMEADTAPCPQKMIPRVFTLLNLVARHSGEHFDAQTEEAPQEFTMNGKKEEPRYQKSGYVLKWSTVRVFTTRMFLESINRVQGVVEVLTKLGYASMHWEESEEEEGVQELVEICIHDVDFIEQFAEFYQYNYFKGGKAEILYVDSMASKVAEALVGVSEGVEPDRRGTVQLEYQEMLQNIKDRYRFDLSTNLISNLEKKGLFVKRTTRDEGVYLSFDLSEFQLVAKFWQVITEIDQWNDTGSVDMTVTIDGAADGELKCPDCDVEITADQKFCMECGCKLNIAA